MQRDTLVTPTGRRRRPSRACHTLAIIGGLILVIIGQFITFPFFLSMMVDSFPPKASHHLGMMGQPYKTQSRHRQQHSQSPDGTFNGIPVYLQQQKPIVSHVHCVGDNYQADAWKQRSCRFENLCFNTTSQEFLLFSSLREQEFAQHFLSQRPHMHTSSTLQSADNSSSTQTVSLGGMNLKWGTNGMQRLEWFPKVVVLAENTPPPTYYAMPEEIVWIPFHSLNGANPGHLVWDDFLPIYTALDMFQLLPNSNNKHRVLFPMRYILMDQDSSRGLWASCDFRAEKTRACRQMMTKFLPLLVGRDYPYQFTTTLDFDWSVTTTTSSVTTDLVCSKTSVAGLASLTDHGIVKMHGWEPDDYLVMHNHGRGGQLYQFRNFMMQNMGFETAWKNPKQHRIVFSQKSSEIFNRNLDFVRQIELLREHIPNAVIEAYVMKELTVQEQLQVVHNASIFITLCGGGAVTAMFLPAGASVILYYSEDGGVKNNRMTRKPALLDWDLFNAMSHLRVHWMPRNSRKEKLDEQALVALVRHELALMDEKVFH